MTKQEFIDRVMLIMNEAGLYDTQGNSFIGADAAQLDRHIEGSYVDAWRRVAKVAPRTWLGNKSFKTTLGIIKTFTLKSQTGTTNTGFAVGDTLITRDYSGTVNATFEVATIGSNGIIVSLTMLTGGSGFNVGSMYYLGVMSGNGSISSDGTITVTAVDSLINNVIANLPDGTGYIKLPDDFYLLTKFKMVGWKVSAMEASISNTRVENIQGNEFTRGSQIRPVVVIDNLDINGLIKPVLKYYSLQKGLTTHLVEEALYVPVVEELSSKANDYELGINDQIIVPLAYLSAATVFTILEKSQVALGLEQRAEAMLPGLVSMKGTNATVKQ